MSDSTTSLDLGTELTIRTATATRAALAPLLAGTGTVHLRAAALERVDTAGVQLLCAFVAALRGAGRAVRWEPLPPAVAAAAATLGLAGALDTGAVS